MKQFHFKKNTTENNIGAIQYPGFFSSFSQRKDNTSLQGYIFHGTMEFVVK